MRGLKWVTGLVAVLLLVAGGVAACGGSDGSESRQDVSIAACGDLLTGPETSPDAIIVSDLPLSGDSAKRSAQMNDAITAVLDDAGWEAGDRSIGFMACDDSDPETGLWSETVCRDNGEAYAAESSIAGVIGTYNSGCAATMIPVLNEAEGGPVPMVSPGNTAICLTQTADTCTGGEPDSLYPSGKRNYARVVPNDAAQGAALAKWADINGQRRAAVLWAKGDATSAGQARTFINAAPKVNVDVVLRTQWDPEAGSYRDLMKRVGKADPDVILLAGLTEQNGGTLIRDKVAVLGPNNEPVGLYAPDGFAQQSTIDQAGPAAREMNVTVPGRAPGLLGKAGKTFVDRLAANLDGEPVEIYAPYAGQAARVLLDAIEEGGSDRATTAAALFGIRIDDGITGSFEITESGDPNVNPVTIFKAGKTFRPTELIEPDAGLVTAARGEG